MKKKKTAQPKIRLGKSKRFTGEKYTALLSSEGTSHAYLNAEIPTKDKRHIGKGGEPVAPLHTAICEVCQHAYAHLMGSGTCRCRECAQDAFIIEHEEPLRREMRDTGGLVDETYEHQEYTASEVAIRLGYRDRQWDGAYGGEHSPQSNAIVG